MTDPVLALIRQRAANRNTGEHQKDDVASLALCIEGGSMRGVVSAGMVAALEQLGLLDCFDAIYGSSAGAMNAAYLLAGQAALGTTIYYDDINNRKFIDLLRPLFGRPVVDLDFLVHEVMVRQKPLDTARVLASRIGLNVIATDADSGTRRLFRKFENGSDLLCALRAGATMPVVAGQAYAYRGGRYFDALLVEPIPVATAEAEGHTHILALLTRPFASSKRNVSFLERQLIVPRLTRMSVDLAKRYTDRPKAYAAMMAAIAAGSGPAGKAKVTAIRPDGPVVGQLERGRHTLVGGAARGAAAVMFALTGSHVTSVETLSGFDSTGHRVRELNSIPHFAEDVRNAGGH